MSLFAEKGPLVSTQVGTHQAASTVRRLWLTAMLLGAFGGTLYVPLIHTPFLADDYPHLISLLHPSLMQPGQRVFSLSATQFRPFEFLLLKGVYVIGGYSPIFAHVFYMLLHGLVVLEVFFLLHLITNNYRLATLTSLLFVVYPRNVEAVMWIGAAENEVVMTCFVLAGMISWVCFRRKGSVGFLFVTTLCFILGLLTKESAGPFPAVLFAIDLYLKGQLSWRSIRKGHTLQSLADTARKAWPIFTVLALYAVFAIYHLNIAYHAAGHSAYGFVGISRLAHYVLEYPLMGLVPFITHSWAISWKHSVLLAPLVLFITYAWLSSKRQIRALGVVWFWLFCLPTMLLSPFGVSDLYFYLPIIGLCVSLADFLLSTAFTRVRLLVTAGLVTSVLLVTIIYEARWMTDMHQFTNTRQKVVWAAEQHPQSILEISNLPQADGSVPLFMNAAGTLIRYYVPSFSGHVIPKYSNLGSGVMQIKIDR